jgi:hypothetical protein
VRGLVDDHSHLSKGSSEHLSELDAGLRWGTRKVDKTPGRERFAWNAELGVAQVPSARGDRGLGATLAIGDLRWRENSTFDLYGSRGDADSPRRESSRCVKVELVAPVLYGLGLLRGSLSALVDHCSGHGWGQLSWRQRNGLNFEAFHWDFCAAAELDQRKIWVLDGVAVLALQVVDHSDLLAILLKGFFTGRSRGESYHWRVEREGVSVTVLITTRQESRATGEALRALPGPIELTLEGLQLGSSAVRWAKLGILESL